VLDRPSDDGLVESHYCLGCYEHRYVRPPTGRLAVVDDPLKPADPPAFPLSRFAIKDMMLIAGFFAVLNAALAAFMRSGLIPGSPAQIDWWAIKASLIVNPFFAILLVESICLSWLRKVHLRKITGDVPLPQLKAIRRLDEWTIAWEGASPRERVLLILCLTWPFTWFYWSCLLIPRWILNAIIDRNDFGLVVAAVPLIVLCIEAFLLWGLVASTRRR
jgi:hypothetical protein